MYPGNKYNDGRASEDESSNWEVRDEWLAKARRDFRQTLQEWKEAMLGSDDGANWARQDAVKQAADEIDKNNQGASSAVKDEFENVRHAIMSELQQRQDERLGVKRRE